MPRPLLNDVEIRETPIAVRASFRAIQRIQLELPGGRHIQLPRIPSILSESIVAREIRLGQAPLWQELGTSSPGGRSCDLLAKVGNKVYKVQVKATGSQGFQYLGPKDIVSDVLVWLHFGAFFEKDDKLPVECYWLPRPSNFFQHDLKISLPKFKQIVAGKLRQGPIRLIEF